MEQKGNQKKLAVLIDADNTSVSYTHLDVYKRQVKYRRYTEFKEIS